MQPRTSASPCPVCEGMEPRTVDRLLLVGYGPRFIAQRWGITRQAVARHRDHCLAGERRKRVEEDLRRMGEARGEGATVAP